MLLHFSSVFDSATLHWQILFSPCQVIVILTGWHTARASSHIFFSIDIFIYTFTIAYFTICIAIIDLAFSFHFITISRLILDTLYTATDTHAVISRVILSHFTTLYHFLCRIVFASFHTGCLSSSHFQKAIRAHSQNRQSHQPLEPQYHCYWLHIRFPLHTASLWVRHFSRL